MEICVYDKTICIKVVTTCTLFGPMREIRVCLFVLFCVWQIGFLKEVGLKLTEVSSRGVHGMYFLVFVVESNFQMAVESNYAIPIATLYSDWLKNSAPVFFSTKKERNQNKPHLLWAIFPALSKLQVIAGNF